MSGVISGRWKFWCVLAVLMAVGVLVFWQSRKSERGKSTPLSENKIATESAKGYMVTKVVDGDTLKVDAGGKIETVRLIGVDTPELVDPRKPVQCFAEEASQKTKALLVGRRVMLEADPTQGDRDKYGRWLRYVRLDNGEDLGKILIGEGYAHEYTYRLPYKMMEEYKRLQTEAREKERGLWRMGICRAN